MEYMSQSATILIDSLISLACEAGASDLHLDPREHSTSVRMRVDGSLRVLTPISKTIHAELIARLKVLSGLRTDEHFVPQDGRFRYEGWERPVDIRLSIAPTYYGENAVLRLLTRTHSGLDLPALGLSEDHQQKLIESLSRTHGMLLVTGPTGSGKTTTLYELMGLIAKRPISLVTIEDPIEYALDGAVQMQVSPNCTFASGLRGILRQDPDVIMVGEIRDTETAALAVNAALTGHLVLSTLHTNDAPSSLSRLMNLGIEPYLISSTVSVIVGQRLARRICTGCAIEEKLTEAERGRLERIFGTSLPQWVSVGRGCTRCDGSGYRGRIGIYEILKLSQELSEAVLSRIGSRELRTFALAAGMQPLLLDGLEKVTCGLTTVEEVLRLTYV